MDNSNIIKLAIDTMHGTVSGDFSKESASEVLRKAFVEANGGENTISPKTFYRGSAMYALVEELLPIVIQEGLKGDENLFQLVDYRNLAEGDKNEFWVPDNSEFVVSKIANGVQSLRRQRLNIGANVSIDTQMRGIKVYEELSRLMAGRVDFNTFVDRVATSFAHNMRQDIVNVLEGVTASTTGLSSTYVKSGTFDAATLRTLIDHVEAATGAQATILGTKAGLTKVIDSSTNGISLTSASAKEDLYQLGYLGRFYGTPMMSMANAHKPGTETFAINDDKIYVIAGSEKPLQYVTEGNGLLLSTDATANADLTQEYTYAEKTGCAAIFNQKMGIYTLA